MAPKSKKKTGKRPASGKAVPCKEQKRGRKSSESQKQATTAGKTQSSKEASLARRPGDNDATVLLHLRNDHVPSAIAFSTSTEADLAHAQRLHWTSDAYGKSCAGMIRDSLFPTFLRFVVFSYSAYVCLQSQPQNTPKCVQTYTGRLVSSMFEHSYQIMCCFGTAKTK